MSRCVALIPAAGTGLRMGDSRPKQYLPLLGRPMLAWSIEALFSHPRIESVQVVLSPDDEWFERYDWALFGARLRARKTGADTRARSVANGLQALAPEIDGQDWVLVHDAARPCLTPLLLERLIATVDNDPVGGLLATRVAETLKRADAQARVATTESRERLWQAQTPQMFRCALLQRALAAADLGRVTDEASAVEQLGLRPLLVESSVANLKVTFPDDLQLAEAILSSRQRKSG
ncbi:MAG TPA: 2-C-methyl-D-erythritol 4-phosphate cytidylyltransferase [Burkholderiales bacterium]|jgi:2-C-methyl-D-erythritol 4-phosphate cytidylyltransferase|nr:2-C-methyl-D-erythritol 4-phosphate cytidylyltransferase [Burkholderiales bacterium]